MRVIIGVSVLALVAATAQTELIQDGEFDATATWQTVNTQSWVPGTDDVGRWYGAIWWQRTNDGSGGALAELSSTNRTQYNLLQVIDDGSTTQGLNTLSFDMTGTWRGYVYAIGYDEAPTLSLTSSPPSGAGLFVGETTLLEQSPLPGSHDTNRVELPMDFGDGHDVVVISFKTYGNAASRPRLDNVHLTPEPLSVGLLGLGGLGLLRRRRAI